MGSWPSSATSSGSESIAKMSKSGTNSPNMLFNYLALNSLMVFLEVLLS